MAKIGTFGKQRSTRLAFLALLIMTIVTATLHLGAQTAQAAQATVTWSAPTTNTNGTSLTDLAGYKIYYGTTSGNYTQKTDVGNVTSYTLVNLNTGSTYYFVITAYDTSGLESTYSTEVSKAIPAAASTFPITATAGAGGAITALNNTNVSTASNTSSTITTVTVSSGANQSFTITPSTGYKVQGVTVDGVSLGAVASYTFSNVTANHTISATFAPASYTITASAGTGGSISPSGSASVTSGGSQTFAISPATGYQVSAVTVDGASVGAVSSYTFSNVTANHTISATFASATTNYTITASAGTGGSISPSGSVSVTSGASQTFTIAPASGYKISAVTVDGASVGGVSTYTFTNVTGNHTIQASFASTTTGGSSTVFATNSGGSQYVNSTSGVTYVADSKYSGGSVGSTTAAISGTSDTTLYQTERWGNFSYSIPVSNGNYNVTLKFAEIHWSAAGKRVFNVAINGQTVISNLDIYAKVGKNMAYDVVVPVSVTNGAINITFASVVDYAKVNAIAVAPSSNTTTAGSIIFAANSAGPNYTSSSTNTTYGADTMYSGGSTGSTTASIAGTSDGTLYQTERWGNSSYSIPVQNGNYNVTLKFAEIYWSAAGKRIFNVVINGQTVVSNLDIYARVGKNVAYDLVLPVSVTNGVMNINFVSVADYAKISAILVKSS